MAASLLGVAKSIYYRKIHCIINYGQANKQNQNSKLKL